MRHHGHNGFQRSRPSGGRDYVREALESAGRLPPLPAKALTSDGRAIAEGPQPIAIPPKPKLTWRDSTIMARDLCDKEFPAVKFIVPGLFSEGVALLVSRPKLGKSWLLQQIGSAVAVGNGVLASPVEPDKPAHGDVLYLNLEDGERRAQRRMTKYFGATRESWPERLTIARSWRRV